MSKHTCRSDMHDEHPVDGTVSGTYRWFGVQFPGRWYCEPCSVSLRQMGLFVPDPVTV